MRPHPLRFERLRIGLTRASRRFARDSRGATAVEFGMVAAPFFALVIAIMTIGTQYLTLHFLEHGVTTASRKLRTGEAQKAGLTIADFRKLVCDSAGTMIACDSRLVIHIKSSPTFAGLSPLASCMTNGNLTPSAGQGTDSIKSRSGNASTAVAVTACYEWSGGAGLWNVITSLVSPTPQTQGKTVLSTASAFRSEPYPD
jgi:Flp pilus assembly protein TadG